MLHFTIDSVIFYYFVPPLSAPSDSQTPVRISLIVTKRETIVNNELAIAKIQWEEFYDAWHVLGGKTVPTGGSSDTLTTPEGVVRVSSKPSAYGLRFAFGKSLVRLHNSLMSCESILGNLPRGQFYLPTPAAFTLFIPQTRLCQLGTDHAPWCKRKKFFTSGCIRGQVGHHITPWSFDPDVLEWSPNWNERFDLWPGVTGPTYGLVAGLVFHWTWYRCQIAWGKHNV